MIFDVFLMIFVDPFELLWYPPPCLEALRGTLVRAVDWTPVEGFPNDPLNKGFLEL